MTYVTEYERSLSQPEEFWADAAGLIDWDVAPQWILDSSNKPFYHWFPDGVLNTCYNTLDRHVEHGRGDQLALVHDSPVTGTQRTFTYSELRDEVANLAGALTDLGVTKGDTVIVYMPMIPEAAIVYTRASWKAARFMAMRSGCSENSRTTAGSRSTRVTSRTSPYRSTSRSAMPSPPPRMSTRSRRAAACMGTCTSMSW